MTPDLIARYARPIPRYTSYPTANHFSDRIGAEDCEAWVRALPVGSSLSLYVHIPYCQELCWYCGCSTKAVRRYAPVHDYVALLESEIARVAAMLPEQCRVTHVHWGGGSPDILKADDIERLGAAIRSSFALAADAEIAVEIDPRLMSEQQADAFAAIGVNRISIGVQDFDEAVQRAIGRLQSYTATRDTVRLFRQRGVGSINIDLVYGLPNQTTDSVARTLQQVLALAPDRIAIFGYAHLPSRLKHQRLIDEAALPGAVERFAQSQLLARLLAEAGYVQRGLDHFAKGDDALASAALARNFQGYTTDRAEALLGFGASAISRLPQGYAQNAVAVDDYARRLAAGGLATARGHRLSREDVERAYVIERMMCDFAVDWRDVEARFGERPAACGTGQLDDGLADGLVVSTTEGLAITDAGRPFVRNFCADFDAYLPRAVENRRHALSV